MDWKLKNVHGPKSILTGKPVKLGFQRVMNKIFLTRVKIDVTLYSLITVRSEKQIEKVLRLWHQSFLLETSKDRTRPATPSFTCRRKQTVNKKVKIAVIAMETTRKFAKSTRNLDKRSVGHRWSLSSSKPNPIVQEFDRSSYYWSGRSCAGFVIWLVVWNMF